MGQCLPSATGPPILRSFPRFFEHPGSHHAPRTATPKSIPEIPYALAALSLTSITLLAGCGSDYPLREAQKKAAEANTSNLRGTLTGCGSIAQNSAMNAWTFGLSVLHPKVQVQYASVGSGAGREGHLAAATEFAGSDAFLKGEEIQRFEETCEPDGAINIPT